MVFNRLVTLGNSMELAHHNLAARRSPDFYLTTTDAGGKFVKFSSRFFSAAPALNCARWSFAKSAPSLTAAGNRFLKSGQRPTNAGSIISKSGKALAQAGGHFTKSAASPTVAGRSFAKFGDPFTKSDDALDISEHAFSQPLAIEVAVFYQSIPVFLISPDAFSNHQPLTNND